MSGKSRQIVDLNMIIENLIDEIKSIDNDDALAQTVRTKKYRRAANKVRSRLYEDGRRKETTKLKLSTYDSYLILVRRAFRKTGWKHHSLPKTVIRLSKKYPEFSDKLKKLMVLDSEKSRTLLQQMKADAKELKQSTRKRIYREAYNDFCDIKIDHDVLRYLAKDALDDDESKDAKQKALEERKRNTIDINYNWVLARINELTSTRTFSTQALGLALACGRRPIEILYLGRFKAVGEYTVEFSGQAKERGGVDYDNTFEIYTLIPAALFVEKMDAFRKLAPVQALKQYDGLPYNEIKTQINRRTGKTLVEAAKKVFGNDDAMFKWSRAIWSRAVIELHFESDPRWKTIDEDVFWQEMLGHSDTGSQAHYKYVKMSFDPIDDIFTEEPDYTNARGENIRVTRLTKLSKDYRIAKRKALVKINDYVIASIEKDPTVTFTQSMITREVGSSRPAIKDYFTLVNDKLGEILTKPEKAVRKKPAKKKADNA